MMKQIDVINLHDMTRESLIRYSFSCLEKSLEEGWTFDWVEMCNKEDKLCCLGGAIKVQHPEVYTKALGIVGLDKLNPITYVSQVCAQSIEKTWKHKILAFVGREWRVKPTLNGLLNESRSTNDGFRE